MKRVREVFKSFIESESELHVEFGMGTEHAMNGFGIVPFLMDSRGTLKVKNVLWVP
jgi:hypothetical protein